MIEITKNIVAVQIEEIWYIAKRSSLTILEEGNGDSHFYIISKSESLQEALLESFQKLGAYFEKIEVGVSDFCEKFSGEGIVSREMEYERDDDEMDLSYNKESKEWYLISDVISICHE